MSVTHFIWDLKNTAHIAEHGVTIADAEHVVRTAEPPYPMYWGEGKWLVWGRNVAGDLFQVIYVMESDADIDYTQIDLMTVETDSDGIYIIHARPLTTAERKRFKKKRK